VRNERNDRVVILALFLMVLGSSSQVMIVAPILPRIGEELVIAPALLGTLVTGFALTLSIFALTIGPISDRFGRRPVLLAGTGTMTVALLLHPLAFDYPSMLAARIFAGAAAGMLTGSAISYVGDYFPYQRRGWASGWVMSGFAVGQILAIPAGTLLADRFGFHTPFLAFAAVMAVSFLLILVAVPQPNISRRVEGLSVRSAIQTYADLLRQPDIRGASLAYATMFFAVSSFMVYLPTWAELDLDMTAEDIALLFVVGGIASVSFGPRVGSLSDRLGRKPLILVSCAGTSIAFALAPILVSNRLGAFGLMFTVMVLLALRLSPFQALLTALVEDRERGSLMSLVVSVGQLGGGLGAALAGVIYADVGFVGCAFAAATAILSTAVVVLTKIHEPASDGLPRLIGEPAVRARG
jgi:predicted MFS family arabinose efflux permease